MLVKKNKKVVNEFIKIQNKRLLDRIQREFYNTFSKNAPFPLGEGMNCKLSI